MGVDVKLGWTCGVQAAGPLFARISGRDSSCDPQQLFMSESRTIKFEGFVGSDFRTLRDLSCTTFGPEFNCARRVDV